MKFATWERDNQIESGVILDKHVISFYDIQGENISITEFIKREPDLAEFKNLLSQTEKRTQLNNVKLRSPILYPQRNVFCIGKNYKDHIDELANFTGVGDTPSYPIYFTKSAFPAIGSDETIYALDSSEKLDYEVELCLVIGKGGKKIEPQNVYDSIFGYSILNDVSARDIQKRHTQWFLGKSLDNCCPIGPYIVPKESFSFPPKLEIESRVNGEVRQHSNTENMIFSIERIVSEISKYITLYPGDLIATGTPSGVGQGFTPPRYLKKNDIVECEIENIGVLRNKIN